MRTRPEPHISFIFTNNIVYFDSGNLLGSDWSNEHYVIDGNLYWRVGGTSNSMKFAGVTLDQWRARGHDQHSLIADPLFVAPEKYDFRFQRKSPGFALGFHQVDLSNVGVRRQRTAASSPAAENAVGRNGLIPSALRPGGCVAVKNPLASADIDMRNKHAYLAGSVSASLRPGFGSGGPASLRDLQSNHHRKVHLAD